MIRIAAPRNCERPNDTFSYRSTHMRVACVTWPGKKNGSVHGLDSNAAEAMAALGRLISCEPDLVCLPEGFLYAGIDTDSAQAIALESDSPIMAQFAALARDLKIYLVVPFMERTATAIHNAVVVFDRSGHPVETYRKRVLWPSNDLFNVFERSAVPGNGGSPIQTEFGPFGIKVCFEVHWPGPWRLLKSQNVRLILFPSEQSGGMLIRNRAWQTRSYIVSAVSKGGPSQVIDPIGNIIAEWEPETPSPVIDLGLTFELVHCDHNDQKMKELAAAYQGKIKIVTHHQERLHHVTSCDPALDLKSVLQERNILLLDEYLRRVKLANDAARTLSGVDSRPRPSKPTGSVARSAPKVSVIVPCLNVPPSLQHCLRSLQAQQTDYPFEVILVFNGPGAEDIKFEWPGIKILREPRRGPAAARNAGVRASNGDILAFVDSDCIAAPDWLNSAVQTLRRCRNRCIAACAITRSDERRNRVSLYDSVTYLQQEQYVRRSQSFVTANLCVPRELFNLIGFFDESFEEAACEDWEWASRARRRGVSVVYGGDAAVEHPCMVNLRQLRAKVERLARGELTLKSRTRRRVSKPELFSLLRAQLRRIAANPELGVADKFRLMSLALPVAYWSWRAARRFNPAAKKAGGKTASTFQ